MIGFEGDRCPGAIIEESKAGQVGQVEKRIKKLAADMLSLLSGRGSLQECYGHLLVGR